MLDVNEQIAKKVINPRISLQEYLVDFLGGLVPGMLFIIATILGLIPPVYALSVCLSGSSHETLFDYLIRIFESTKDTPSAIWIVLFLGAVLFAYIVGHIFYRHDPKMPDRKSFRRLAMYYKNIPEKMKSNLGCTSEEDCEFPYPFYDKYLIQRGLKYLLPLVVWKGRKRRYRSKVYINLLKINLRYYSPDKCGIIIRNEAHVRLASSTWHVARLLFWFGIFGL